MEQRELTPDQMEAFLRYLEREERSAGTREKYARDIRAFHGWLEGRSLTKEEVAGWKAWLLARGYSPTSINSMLVAVHMLLKYLGWEDCRVRLLRLQRKMFREPERELTLEEYRRLVNTARTLGKTRLALLIECICATGMRVSEVQYVTVEAVRRGKVRISLKGKIRVILLPRPLCRKLLQYAAEQGVTTGTVFCTRSGRSISRKQIWAEMKALCRAAGVESSKVYPHNLRHLFAREFYGACRDVVKLADVLGHSSIETTRIYLLDTGEEHIRQMECLRLIC